MFALDEGQQTTDSNARFGIDPEESPHQTVPAASSGLATQLPAVRVDEKSRRVLQVVGWSTG